MKIIKQYFQRRKQRVIEGPYKNGFKWVMYEHCKNDVTLKELSRQVFPTFNVRPNEIAFDNGARDAITFCEKNLMRDWNEAD